MAPEYNMMEMMICVASRYLQDGKNVAVGTGAPCAAAMLSQKTQSPNLIILFEAGGISPMLPQMPISVGDSRTFHQAIGATSMHEVMSLSQAGYLDYGFIGAAQIDRFGNINTTAIVIVFDDADLDSAVEGVVDAIWFNQGQVCCAGSRLLVQEGVADKMYAKLKARMEKLRVGDPLDKTTDVGAIVSPSQRETIDSYVQKGKAEGADILQPSTLCPTDGYYYPPTLCMNVAPASTIAQEEIFRKDVADVFSAVALVRHALSGSRCTSSLVRGPNSTIARGSMRCSATRDPSSRPSSSAPPTPTSRPARPTSPPSEK